MCVCVCLSACVQVYGRVCRYACVCPGIRACVQVYVHVCRCTCICEGIRVSVLALVCTVCECEYVCARVCFIVSVHVCVCAYNKLPRLLQEGQAALPLNLLDQG